MKLLVVEDDPKASAALVKGLSESGFVVDAAATGDLGLQDDSKVVGVTRSGA